MSLFETILSKNCHCCSPAYLENSTNAHSMVRTLMLTYYPWCIGVFFREYQSKRTSSGRLCCFNICQVKLVSCCLLLMAYLSLHDCLLRCSSSCSLLHCSRSDSWPAIPRSVLQRRAQSAVSLQGRVGGGWPLHETPPAPVTGWGQNQNTYDNM